MLSFRLVIALFYVEDHRISRPSAQQKLALSGSAFGCRDTNRRSAVTPGCKMVGRSIGQMRLRRRFGVYTLAVHRRNQSIGE